MKKSDFKYILSRFFVWRTILVVLIIFGAIFFPLQRDHLGGGKENYLQNPLIWSLVNFDGEHFLSLAKDGYQPLMYFFFPLYPVMIKFIAGVFGKSFIDYVFSGLLISNLSFIVALIGLWKLITLDFSKKIAKSTLLLLLLFPTSFYFGMVYSESIFLMLAVWSFYFARKEKWIYASILAGLASATRVVGIVMLPVILTEYYLRYKKMGKLISNKLIPILAFSLSGVLAYLYFLQKETGDWMVFIKTVSIFGEQRSSQIIALPQVFFRYLFKIIPNLSYSYMPGVLVASLELFVAILFLFLGIYSFDKLPASYSVYLFTTYLIPTLSGSFSSLPRYVLICFPGFILIASFVSKLPKVIRISLFVLLFILLVICTALFSRGYWIS